MEDEQPNGWPTWAAVVSILAALLIGLFLGWIAHGLMMHRMRDGSGGMMNGGMMGMMGNRGMMGGSEDGSGSPPAGMMARCQGMMGEGGCPMMRAMGDTQRQSPEQLESEVFDELDEATRDWVRTIRGDVTPEDVRGEDSVTVDVGAGEQGLTFQPSVLRIDPGTPITFRWTGRGGVHDVTFLESDRGSSLTYEAGHTWKVTLDEPGVLRYVCSPHRTIGMKGLVLVG